MQDAFNLLPNLNVDKLSRSFAVKSNDMMLVIYLSSMVRSVLALHDLIDNREGELMCISYAECAVSLKRIFEPWLVSISGRALQLCLVLTEHRMREAKEDAEAATKEAPAKDKKADDAAEGGSEESKGEKQQENGSTGPDAANGGF